MNILCTSPEQGDSPENECAVFNLCIFSIPGGGGGGESDIFTHA